MTEAALAPGLDRRVGEDVVRLYLQRWRGSLIAVTLFTLGTALAGRAYATAPVAIAWCAVSCLNYLGQAFVSWRMEQSSSLQDAMRRWMPWLVASVATGGLIWGAVPWLLSTAAVPVQLFAGLFNLMLFFAVVNAPSTRAMIVAAASIAPPTILALAWRVGQLEVALGGAIAFGLVLVYGMRVQAAVQRTQAERLVASDLAAELRRHQQRLVEIENERTLLLERERLMRDMHDGLGSTLLSSLAAAERGLIGRAEVAELLRDCVDDLRAVIDSLEPVEHDLVALLAMLRFRLGRRLDAAGIALEWHMGDLPALDWLGPSEALHVMRAVQESFANVVKHAHATRVRVSASHAEGLVRVCVTDDGRGFDADAAQAGRGLRQLRKRAQLLGGRIDIRANAGQGTSISLEIPVTR